MDTVYDYTKIIKYLDELHLIIRELFFMSITNEFKGRLP